MEGECAFPFDNLCLSLLNALLQGVEQRSAAKIVYDPDPTNDVNY